VADISTVTVTVAIAIPHSGADLYARSEAD
jgi:hypothetical protein